MTKGRKTTPGVDVVTTDFDPAIATRKSAAATELATLTAGITERFGDGLPYDRARVVHEARFYMAHSAEAMLEAGKRLVLLKENEPHGEFIEIVTGQLGLGRRSAQLMMAAAVKYLSPALESKAKSISLLSPTKLYDLMLESDEDLAELAEGGTIAGLDLDDIQSMSTRELRNALREARETMAAKDRVIESKNKKLDKLAEQNHRNAPLPEQEAFQLDQLRDDTLAAETALQRLLATVDETMQSPATQATETAARHSLDYLVQRIVDGCLERGITVDLAERVTPIWSQQIESAAKRGKKS